MKCADWGPDFVPRREGLGHLVVLAHIDAKRPERISGRGTDPKVLLRLSQNEQRHLMAFEGVDKCGDLLQACVLRGVQAFNGGWIEQVKCRVKRRQAKEILAWVRVCQ